MYGILPFCLAVLSTLAALSSAAPAAPLSSEPHRILYQIYVRAFYDGSGTPDGVGDFAGLVEQIPYFQDLGVDTLLLMPIMKNAGGMGYIPRDYSETDAAYGSLMDFEVFAAAAHAAGLKIMLDLPINHISDDSEWFRRGSARACDEPPTAGDESQTFCNFFYFTAEPCTTVPYAHWHKPWDYDRTDCHAVWYPKWGYDPAIDRSGRYYATFSQSMPDLKYWDFEQNAFNEPVVSAVQEAIEDWTALGVDAFRLDAAKHLIEGAADNRAAVPEPHNVELMHHLLTAARAINPSVSFAGEIWADYATIEPYIGPAMDMAFDFPFMSAVRDSVAASDAGSLRGTMGHLAATLATIKPGQRIVFATNHDMPRLMSEWRDNEAKVRMAQFLTLMTPFTPLLYYGEELGMHGAVKRPTPTSPEEYVRTIYAFPWTSGAAAGFPGDIVPIVGLSDNTDTHNLAAERADAASLWTYIKTVISLRQAFPLTNETRLTVDSTQYGSALSYTLATPQADGTTRCRSVAINAAAAPHTRRVRHLDPGCQAVPMTPRFIDNVTSSDQRIFQFGAYGKIVVGD